MTNKKPPLKVKKLVNTIYFSRKGMISSIEAIRHGYKRKVGIYKTFDMPHDRVALQDNIKELAIIRRNKAHWAHQERVTN